MTTVQEMYQTCVGPWRKMVASCWTSGSNIFLSQADLGLVGGMIKEVDEQIKTVEVKLNNVVMLMR